MTITEAGLHPVTEAAMKAIGHDHEDDYRLTPKKHAQRLPPEAGALRRVLEQPDLLATIDGYDIFDRQAGQAQKTYKGICKRTLAALAVATLAGLVAVVVPWAEPYDVYVRIGAIVLVYGAMAYAFRALRTLHRAQPYKTWHVKRANAETMRGRLFRSVMAAAPAGIAGPGEIALLPLKLEYVRRYHLDVQQSYYEGRARQSEGKIARAEQVRRVGGIVVLVCVLAMLAAAIAPLTEPIQLPGLAQWLLSLLEFAEIAYLDIVFLAAGLGVMVLYGLMLAYSSIDNDMRNAGRYRAYFAELRKATDSLPEQRRLALDEGNAANISAFVGEVQELLDAEHRDWKLMQEATERARSSTADPGGWLRRLLPRHRRAARDPAG